MAGCPPVPLPALGASLTAFRIAVARGGNRSGGASLVPALPLAELAFPLRQPPGREHRRRFTPVS